MPRHTVFLAALVLSACSSPTVNKKVTQAPVVAVKNETKKDTSGKPVGQEKRDRDIGPKGEVVMIDTPGNQVVIVDETNAKRKLEPDTLHPPAGDRGLIGISAQAASYLDDGTLLVGVSDGTLIALDNHDKPKWSIGFRGAVTGIVPAEEDRVIVTTQRGVVASVKGSTGQVLWEKHLFSGALTPAAIGPDEHIYVAGPRGVLAFADDGTLVFSHASSLGHDICCTQDPKDVLAVDAAGHITGRGIDLRTSDPHPPIVDTIPIYVADYEKVLDEPIYRMISAGPDAFWLLVDGKKGSELLRYSGGKTQRFAIPKRGTKAVQVDEDSKPEKPSFEIDEVTIGPNGNPWLLARSIFSPPFGQAPWWSRPAPGAILELNGTTIRERTDLTTVFDEHPLTTSSSSHIRAVTNDQTHLFCFGENKHVCALYQGSQPDIIPHKEETSFITNVGKTTYIVLENGTVQRLDGSQFLTVATPKEAGSRITAVGGLAENDMWLTTDGELAYHWDGKTFVSTDVPEGMSSGVVASSSTDVWSRNGRVHWDGKRWTSVAGAQGAAAIVVRGPGDIWVGNKNGLFHQKPTTRSSLRWPEAKSVDTMPLAEPHVLTLGAPLVGYIARKTSLDVKNGPPVSTAKRVEVARDGTLWLEAWDRLLEVDASGKATVLDQEEKHIAFDRWFYPEGPGRGIFAHRKRESYEFNGRDELRQFQGGKSAKLSINVPGHDIMAIAGNALGAAWILGSVEAHSPYQLQGSSEDELGIHALVRADEKSPFQTVVGLPPVSYRDVAVTPEGGGFFVGALNSGPMGEGFILHARGRLGTESVTRYRAPATIFAVAAVSNDEAWAVGAMGLIVHIKGNVIERHVIPSGSWLRAVVANGPNDIWVAGDDGTLLHSIGGEFRPLAHSLGPRAAFSGLCISRGIVWAASPSGILRIVQTGTTAPM